MAAKTPTAEQFKKELKYRSAHLSEIEGVLPDGQPVVATVKVDGELEVWDADAPAGHFGMVNRNEKPRFSQWIADNVLLALKRKGYQSARGAGELYVREQPKGRVEKVKGKYPEWPLMEFGPAMGQIQKFAKPTASPGHQRGFRLAVFDLFELDGRVLWGKVPYAERFALLFDIFHDGSNFVHPVIGQTDVTEASPIRALWDKHVLEEGYEGLVIRANGSIKVKPVHTIDVVVIGIEPGKGKHTGRMGALWTAFRDWTGKYLVAGKVGTGFSDEEREWWTRHLRKAPGGLKRVQMVRPQYVIEVAAERFTEPEVEQLIWDRTKWKAAGKKKGAVAQHGRFVRRRPDKRVTPYELRLSQIPGYVSDYHGALIPDSTTDTETFAFLVGALQDDLARWASSAGFGLTDDEFMDIYQDTAAKALAMWDRLVEAPAGTVPTGAPRPGQPLFKWLAQIFKHRWIDIQRKRGRHAKGIRQIEFFSPERARRAKQTRRNPRRKRKVHR
jgi:hypothetical protein